MANASTGPQIPVLSGDEAENRAAGGAGPTADQALPVAPAAVPSAPSYPDLPRWLALLLMSATFAAMLSWSWLTWPDATIDFGTQLFVPWRMTQGQVLFRDLAYFKGPLSPSFNAIIFMLFGASLRTLIVTNTILLALTLALLYRLLRRFTDRLAATACIVVAILVFSFIQYRYIANYNWICPYAHEYTHGIAFSLAAVWAAERLIRTRRLRFALLAGVLTGLVFLTTAEVFAACATAMVAGLIIAARRGRPAATIALFAASAGATLIAVLVMLAWAMPLPLALRGLLGSWPWVFDRRIAQLGFYRASMGLDDPSARLVRLGQITLGWLVLFVPIALVALAMRTKRWRVAGASAVRAIIATVLIAAGVIFLRSIPWFELALPLPIWMIALLLALARRKHRRPGDSVRLMLLILALALLGKILLFARVQHYGFALAMPAGVLVVEAMLGTLPRWIDRRGGTGPVFRIAGAGALVAYCIGILFGFHLFVSDKTTTVAGGADHFLADERGAQVNAALKEIALRSGRDDTLAVLPQGLMVNYLSRRAHPNRYLNFMPPEVITAGEETIVAAYEAHPPDLLILTLANVRGDAFLLLDGDYAYGGKMLAWVKQHYEVVVIIPAPPSDPTAQWLLMRPKK